jgi:hypothetical protein
MAVGKGALPVSVRSPQKWGPVVWAVARRPYLWPTAARQALLLAPRGWWRRRPMLPLPEPRYLAFRLTTQYGDEKVKAHPNDVVRYLEWCRAQRG